MGTLGKLLLFITLLWMLNSMVPVVACCVAFYSVVLGTTVVFAVPGVRLVTISRPLLGATVGRAVPPSRGLLISSNLLTN